MPRDGAAQRLLGTALAVTATSSTTGSWFSMANYYGTPIWGQDFALTQTFYGATATGTAILTIQCSTDATAIDAGSFVFPTRLTNGTATALASAVSFDDTIGVIARTAKYVRAVITLSGGGTLTWIGNVYPTTASPG